jgi:hypothetical protein
MKIRTKIEVTYNDGVTGQTIGIVEGNIQDASWMNDFNTIGANYIYSKPDGTQFYKNGFYIENEQIDVLWNAIKGTIPEGLDYRDTNRFAFYLGFIYEMAQTFSIELTDIEIVE